mmetsp:Transcript_11571/g.48623  ORF Transcript_11571/g.48623 Transcript_11571/m.48623 type:complete len:117 (-) Transcript_11571:146-496(-)
MSSAPTAVRMPPSVASERAPFPKKPAMPPVETTRATAKAQHARGQNTGEHMHMRDHVATTATKSSSSHPTATTSSQVFIIHGGTDARCATHAAQNKRAHRSCGAVPTDPRAVLHTH